VIDNSQYQQVMGRLLDNACASEARFFLEQVSTFEAAYAALEGFSRWAWIINLIGVLPACTCGTSGRCYADWTIDEWRQHYPFAKVMELVETKLALDSLREREDV
jgi:hypothetical protein